MKRVAVLMGGRSAEREVSLRSGASCIDALGKSPYEVVPIDVGEDIASVLDGVRPDVALNMLHGPYGEDGTIQGLLEILGIPYTHSGVLASALAMNKDKARSIFKSAGIPVAQGRLVPRKEAAASHPMRPPYVVKPVANGSSVGVYIVRHESDGPLTELSTDDWTFGDEVLVERYVAGKELTCGVMHDRALGVIEITSDLPFYDYTAKYAPGGSQHILPAPISADVYEKVQQLAVAAHRALGCRGVSRSDFRYDETAGELVCLETNTQPGMTQTSLVPDMAKHAGLTFTQLVEWMIEDASLGR